MPSSGCGGSPGLGRLLRDLSSGLPITAPRCPGPAGSGADRGRLGRLNAAYSPMARVLKPAGKPVAQPRRLLLPACQVRGSTEGLLCAPERLLLALADDGWIIRNKVIWAKPNPLPTSISRPPDPHLPGRRPPGPLTPLLLRSRRHPGAASLAFWAKEGLLRSRSAPTGPVRLLASRMDCDEHAQPTSQDTSWGRTRVMSGRSRPEASEGRTSPRSHRSRSASPILATCPEAICTRCGTPWLRRQVTVRRIPVGAHLPRSRSTEIGRDHALRRPLAHRPRGWRPGAVLMRCPGRPRRDLGPLHGGGHCGSRGRTAGA